MIFVEDGFRCSSKHCRHEMLLHGGQYGFYDLNGDCDSCKSECKNDSNCAGVECGKNSKCVWWKHGECGTLAQQARDDPSYKTCMKYDEGKLGKFSNIFLFSNWKTNFLILSF